MRDKKGNPVSSDPHPFGTREGLALEFKEAADALPKDLFETVCAFVNMDGGLIVLGVADDGAITGVEPTAVNRMKAEIASLSNNPNKLDPPYLLFPRTEQIEGKWIIRIQIPASSQVHQTGGIVFLRSEEGDYRLKDPHQIAGLVNRKLSFYTEQRVLPWLGMDNLRADLFEQARTLLHAERRNHPWLKLSDEELLRIGGFIRRDPLSSETGYTLAAALMFGSDETIQQAVPAMVFDALLRRDNVDRYDDRVMLYTNLIDTFDHLMGFVEKHLNDPFYLEGNERISLRDRIFRELVSNLIAHREYTSAAPASLTIFQDKVIFRNPHVPHLQGRIDPSHFTPFPKNPTICRFMLQIGRYEEAGSGIYNVTKYLPIYSHGATPLFEEFPDLFVTTIPLQVKEGAAEAGDEEVAGQAQVEAQEAQVTGEVRGEVAGEVTGEVLRFLRVLTDGALTRSGAQEGLKLKGQANFRDRYLRPALDAGLVEMTIPDKPRSRLQKYRLTEKGTAYLKAQQRT